MLVTDGCYFSFTYEGGSSLSDILSALSYFTDQKGEPGDEQFSVLKATESTKLI